MDFLSTDVLDFWFPDKSHQSTPETYAAFWSKRMLVGMDDAIISRFAELTRVAAGGQLDHWADTPRGRLALLIALEGIVNGLFSDLQSWEKMFFCIGIAHCKGPVHICFVIWSTRLV